MDIGITEYCIGNVKIKIFDRERTIYDVFRYENKMDKEIFNKAMQSYIKDKEILARWKSFCKKILKFDLDFKDVILDIVKFIETPYNAIIEVAEIFYIWNHKEKQYVKDEEL